jgi:hypothetical protein
MRDRLIELIKHDNCPNPYFCSEKCKYSESSDCHSERIADYLLANGVIVPPCKVGDTVYQQDGVRIYESVIEEITIDIAAVRPNKMIFYTNKITFDQTAIGRIIFLTREEAEAARIAAQLSNVL